MKTRRPFSTISYLTEDFLKSKLDDLVNKNIIRFYVYIEHLPEEDEEKRHIHLYVDPEDTIDTVSFNSLFIQFVNKEEKPRRNRPCRPSKFDHWYLYDLHDRDYLESIGQSRKYHYNPKQMVCSDRTDLNDLVRSIDYTRHCSLGTMIRSARSGITMDEFMHDHPLRPVYFKTIQAIWDQYYKVKQPTLFRNGRKTHTPKRKYFCPSILDHRFKHLHKLKFINKSN